MIYVLPVQSFGYNQHTNSILFFVKHSQLQGCLEGKFILDYPSLMIPISLMLPIATAAQLSLIQEWWESSMTASSSLSLQLATVTDSILHSAHSHPVLTAITIFYLDGQKNLLTDWNNISSSMYPTSTKQ